MRYKCYKCWESKEASEFHESSFKNRPVAYVCKKCRSLRDRTKDIYNSSLKKYQNICIQCNKPKKETHNKTCAKCLALQGLRKCKKCEQLLLIGVSFYGRQRICKDC